MRQTYRLDEYGVKPGAALKTREIQRVIDLCRDGGGGTVLIPAGEYRVSGIRLYSDITLRLEKGARLTGSADIADYIDFHVDSALGYLRDEYVAKLWNLPAHYIQAPIVATNAENVSVVGEEGSVIDGSDCLDPEGEEKFRGPMGMVFSRCKNVSLSGYTFVRSANWCHQMDACENVTVRGVTVLGGHDGINVHHCKNVVIEDCVFRTGDDCVAGYNVTNLVVRGCTLNSSCNCFRIGARNMLVEKCLFEGPCEYPHRVSGRHNTLGAFEYYAMACDRCDGDAGGWRIEDCEMRGLDTLMHYDRANGDFTQMECPLADARFARVKGTGFLRPATVAGREGEDTHLFFTDCDFSFREDAPLDARALMRVGAGVTLHIKNTRGAVT